MVKEDSRHEAHTALSFEKGIIMRLSWSLVAVLLFILFVMAFSVVLTAPREKSVPSKEAEASQSSEAESLPETEPLAALSIVPKVEWKVPEEEKPHEAAPNLLMADLLPVDVRLPDVMTIDIDLHLLPPAVRQKEKQPLSKVMHFATSIVMGVPHMTLPLYLPVENHHLERDDPELRLRLEETWRQEIEEATQYRNEQKFRNNRTTEEKLTF